MLTAEVDGESWGTNDSGRGTVLEVEKRENCYYLFWRKGGKTSFLNKITSLGGTTPLLLPSASMGILSEL